MIRYSDLESSGHASVEKGGEQQNVMMPRIEQMVHGNHPRVTLAHWHSHWEINRVAGGNGLYIINGTQYTIQQGDIVLIPPQQLHRVCGTDQLLLEAFHLETPHQMNGWWAEDMSSVIHRIGQTVPHVLYRSMPQCGLLSEVLMDVKQELAQREFGYVSIVQAQYMRLLSLLSRYASKPLSSYTPAPSRGVQTVKEVIRVMEGQLAFPWTLKKLSDLAHLSPSRFSALFQQTVGTSPLDYLIRLRLTYAAQLLTSSNEKIIEIAAESGFRNLSNFNRLFKDHFQMSPSELRDTNEQLEA